MQGPSSPLKLGFQRNSYSRVSYGMNQEETNHEEQITRLLKDNSDVEDNGYRQTNLINEIHYINQGCDNQMEVCGYEKNTWRSVLTWLGIIATAGLLRLVFHWTPHWLLFATHDRCSLARAEKVLVVEQYQARHTCYHVKKVATISANNLGDTSAGGDGWGDDPLDDAATLRANEGEKLSLHFSGGQFRELDELRLFRCKKLSYVWDPEQGEFLQLLGLDKGVTMAVLHETQGLTKYKQYLRRAVYGHNEINVPLRSILSLLFLEVLNPFYVFQVFSFCLWFADDYVYYAVAILIMSSCGIAMSVIQTRRNQLKLRSTIHSSDVMSVVRGRREIVEVIPTEQLVPGDLVVIPSHGCIMHCDAVLLAGNCIVNESMLTGESVPETKTPLPNSHGLYDSKEHAKHTLFCGTHVIQTRYYGNQLVLAVVLRTGFSTAKGALVRSIMYPPPVDFKFDHDSYKFVEMLAGIATIGFVYTVITKYMRGMTVSDIALSALDLITIVVPPALPAAMTVGRFYAQSRLQTRDIYCISPRTINVSGSIDCVCFDKTGTLTEDGLDMWGVLPVQKQRFLLPVKAVHSLETEELLICLATCHSLTIIDNKLTGDPLDLKMFDCTSWTLEEPEVNDNSKFDIIFPSVVKPTKKAVPLDPDEIGVEVGIVKQFPFSSSLQRMSVITRRLGASHFQAFCKGAPEVILSLSTEQSVPADFSSVLEEYTQEGYRVIALAYKNLRKISYAKLDRLTREEVESQLNFLGLIVMENRLKAETSPVLSTLNQAKIRTIMVTGDNILTALSVARDCGIVPPREKVIITQGHPPIGGQPAQLCFTHSNQKSTPLSQDQVCLAGDEMENSCSVTSLDPLACGAGPGLESGQGGFDWENSLSTGRYWLALTGQTWSVVRTHFPELLHRVAARGAVFARMSPDQKQQLVQELQTLGYYVAMCGDGANDCGALKAAHAGISLSEAESSVASPFTSKNANIACVPLIIREGRAALVTSFGIFKYMAAYSLTQFVSVMILYSIDTNLTDKEFLYIDLFLITIFAFFFGRTEAYKGPLVQSPPIMSLISLAPIMSLACQMFLVIGIQWTAFYSVQQFPWYVPAHNETFINRAENIPSYENYAIFSVSCLQYIILAVVFSKGAPYRKSIISNYGFLISLLLMTGLTIYIIIDPFPWLRDQLLLLMPEGMTFRLIILALGLANLVLACIVEYFLVDFVVVKKLGRAKSTASSCLYLKIDFELRNDPSWPPISSQRLDDMLLHVETMKPSRNPAEISEIQTSFGPNGTTNGKVLQSNAFEPRKRISSAIEVALNPSSLAPPKRRHNSETETMMNGSAVHSRRSLDIEESARNIHQSVPNMALQTHRFDHDR